MVQCITLANKEFVIMERKEYERIMAETEADLPPLPEPDEQGLTPAIEYGRILLARKIIRRREAVGLRQADLARKAGIRVETLNRLERGKVNPDEKTLKKILRVLDKAEATKDR
jgi:DNA-binding XRE family transcriptional regulator